MRTDCYSKASSLETVKLNMEFEEFLTLFKPAFFLYLLNAYYRLSTWVTHVFQCTAGFERRRRGVSNPRRFGVNLSISFADFLRCSI